MCAVIPKENSSTWESATDDLIIADFKKELAIVFQLSVEKVNACFRHAFVSRVNATAVSNGFDHRICNLSSRIDFVCSLRSREDKQSAMNALAAPVDGIFFASSGLQGVLSSSDDDMAAGMRVAHEVLMSLGVAE